MIIPRSARLQAQALQHHRDTEIEDGQDPDGPVGRVSLTVNHSTGWVQGIERFRRRRSRATPWDKNRASSCSRGLGHRDGARREGKGRVESTGEWDWKGWRRQRGHIPHWTLGSLVGERECPRQLGGGEADSTAVQGPWVPSPEVCPGF